MEKCQTSITTFQSYGHASSLGNKPVIGVIGLGVIGSYIAERLLSGRRNVVLWNRSTEKVFINHIII